MKSELPPGWEVRPLADCGVWFSGGTPSKAVREYWGGTVPWVGPKDLHVQYVDDAEEHLTEAGVANGTRTVPEDSLLIVVRSMALANKLQIGLTRRRVAFNQDIKAIVPSKGIRPRYLFYAVWGRHDALHALVDEASHGTKRLRTEVLGDFAIPLPPLDEQERVEAILSALDDKIDCNRRLARLLEEIAQAEFQARFVDFVGEKLGDSTIPSGWQQRPISALARYVNGKAFTKYGNATGRMVVRIADLKSGPGASTVYTDHEPPDDDFVARPGDILFAWSGSLDVYRWYRDEALINQHIFKVIPDGVPQWLVYFALKHVMPQFQGIAADKATTMGHIKRSDLERFSIAVAPDEELQRFDEFFAPIFDRSLAAVVEAKTLTKIRNALLPKLISGAIRVPDTADPGEAIEPPVETAA